MSVGGGQIGRACRTALRRPSLHAGLSLVVAGALTGAFVLPTVAPAQGRVQILPCRVQAIVVHRIGAPTVMRVAPSVRARVIRHVPYRRGGLIADVYGTSGVWFQIRNLRAPGRRGPGPKGAARPGGWIHGSRLAIRVRDVGGKSTPLHEEPNAKSRVIARLRQTRRGGRGVMMSCLNGWARLRLGPVIGWVPPQHQCSRPFGACP